MQHLAVAMHLQRTRCLLRERRGVELTIFSIVARKYFRSFIKQSCIAFTARQSFILSTCTIPAVIGVSLFLPDPSCAYHPTVPPQTCAFASLPPPCRRLKCVCSTVAPSCRPNVVVLPYATVTDRPPIFRHRPVLPSDRLSEVQRDIRKYRANNSGHLGQSTVHLIPVLSKLLVRRLQLHTVGGVSSFVDLHDFCNKFFFGDLQN